jgi:hypothetical protein
MDLLLVLLATATFPVVCLAFLLWMARIEDSIPLAIAQSVRTPDPAPVLRIPVRRPALPPATVGIPRQRAGDEELRLPQRFAGSRSAPDSFGGSTNR